jgi:GNAT superfamily N-acetyltransferase
LAFDILRVPADAVAPFYQQNQREALSRLWAFSVIWHEQSYDVAARDGNEIAGAATIRVAASLAHVERVVVIPERRRQGLGRALLDAVAEIANYYNCHKMTAQVLHGGEAQRFFEACGYREEAVLPQHTFKLDVAVMRKFLL